MTAELSPAEYAGRSAFGVRHVSDTRLTPADGRACL